jgi:phage gpG-like protein
MNFNEARKLANQLKKFDSQISDMVTIMGVEAKNHFTNSFRIQGFEDETVKKWEPRERNSYRTRGGTVVDDKSRGILIGKGTARLSRALQYRKMGKYKTMISTGGLKYAKIHNEGGMGRAFGKYSFKMKQRQFIGNSGKLNRKIINKIKSKINIIFA